MESLLRRCQEAGLRLTQPRRLVLKALSESTDHPNAEKLHARASQYDKNLAVATVYRTLHMLEDNGIIERHHFGEGTARYEQAMDVGHDHLIDVESGNILEFHSEKIQKLQEKIAKSFGYKLIGQKVELYCVPIKRK
ncbi:transcriptional repressor [Parvularcula flava]|nr:transcriptional repressor [Aquisalinus luteolus]